MANINYKKTEPIRADPDFKKLVQDLCRFKSFQEKEDIRSSRVTQAIFNQFNKYPELIEEIKSSKLGKWKGRK
jgi:hypothetical protein